MKDLEKAQVAMPQRHSVIHKAVRMIKRILFIFLPVALFLLISTVVLSLSFMNIKYTYEPALTGTAFDYLVDDTYSMAWLFYSVTNIAFAVIYLSALFVFYKLNRKRHM